MNTSKAFTLIELLVVIAIIGILSGFITVSMSKAISSANDAKVEVDLGQINKSLLIYSTENGEYPSTGGSICNIGDPAATGDCQALNNSLIPRYYPIIPINSNSNSYYKYISNGGDDYTLYGILSNGYSYEYSPSKGYEKKIPVNGVCGTANRAYPSIASSYGSDTFCTNSRISTPDFPSEGNPIGWTCYGIYGGLDAQCTASLTPSACVSGGGLTCSETAYGSYTINTYTSTGSTTWTAPNGVTSVEYLVVAGGGGGGGNCGGGGGAGGMLTGTLTVTEGASYDVAVGAGGGAISNGTDSVFSSIRATGGGGGSNYLTKGSDGGSGGGAGASGGGNPTYSGGIGILGQGHDGGGSIFDANIGAGGGGAGANGADGGPGTGGDGLPSDITGTVKYYAGGGGGAGGAGAGVGGKGGGAAGTTKAYTDGLPGENGTGGGGGGTYYGAGGSGGSGIVIIRYIQQ